MWGLLLQGNLGGTGTLAADEDAVGGVLDTHTLQGVPFHRYP